MNVLITGGTKGIGRAIVDIYMEHGAHVAICARSGDALDRVGEELRSLYTGQKVYTYICDVSDRAQVISLGQQVLSDVGHVDVLVNNAGVFLPGNVSDEEDGRLEMMIDTNLYSAYHLTRSILPSMLERRRGHIFNMCSVASQIAYPNGGSYSISKFALLGFSKVLREELKDKGVRVTSILPGATWSDSWAGVELPEERLMQARDVAIAVWAASTMSDSAVMEEIVMRPQQGDL